MQLAKTQSLAILYLSDLCTRRTALQNLWCRSSYFWDGDEVIFTVEVRTVKNLGESGIFWVDGTPKSSKRRWPDRRSQNRRSRLVPQLVPLWYSSSQTWPIPCTCSSTMMLLLVRATRISPDSLLPLLCDLCQSCQFVPPKNLNFAVWGSCPRPDQKSTGSGAKNAVFKQQMEDPSNRRQKW